MKVSQSGKFLVLVTDTSQPLKEHEQWTLDRWKSVLWSDEFKFEIFGSTRRFFVRRRVGERMLSACVVPTVNHGGEVWWCGDALLVTLSLIYLEFKTHLTSMATTAFRSETPSHLVWTIFFFSTGQWPNSVRLCKVYLTKKESDGVMHQMTWPPQSPDLNPIEMVWDKLDRRVKEKLPTSAQHMWELFQVCWKSIPHEAVWENAKSVQSCH